MTTSWTKEYPVSPNEKGKNDLPSYKPKWETEGR